MNTFFSTLASSMGGLIGVISAFLITKVLSLEEEKYSLQKQLKNAIIDSEELKELLHQQAFPHFINKFRDHGDRNIRTKIAKMLFNKEVIDKAIKNKLFYDEICLFDNKIEVIKEIDQIEKEIKELSTDSLEELSKKGIFAAYSRMPNTGYSNFHNKILEIKLNVDTNIKKNKNLLEDLNLFENLTKEIKHQIIILMSLFFIGLIYPLSYLKYPNEVKLDYTLTNNFFSEILSKTGIILLIVSVIFFIFILRILSINNKNIISKLEKNELKKYLKYTAYSIFLVNFYKNINE